MKYLELIEMTLKNAEKPMTVPEIWKSAEKLGLTKQLRSTGKTPENTINAMIHRNISSNTPIFKQDSQKSATFSLFKK